MLAYKTQLSINNELLFLKIPSNFKGKRVEIIVLETFDLDDKELIHQNGVIDTFYETFTISKDDIVLNKTNQMPNKFQKILLNAPTWSDTDYQNFLETRKLFNQWKMD
jgi:hypothetical protein